MALFHERSNVDVELRADIEPIEHQRLRGTDYFRDAEGKVWTWRQNLGRYIKVNNAGRLLELGWVRNAERSRSERPN